MNKIIIPLIFLVLTAFPIDRASGYSIPASAGGSGLAFLKVGIGGRNLAMADAGAASAYDATAVYYNPALLPAVESRGLFFSYHNFIQDINQQYVGGNFQWLGKNYFGFGINLFTVPDIERRTSPTVQPLSQFDSRDFSIGLSWGRYLTDKLSIGLGAKMVYEKIDVEDLTGYAADIGVTYDIMHNFRAAAVAKNVGPQVKFIEEEFDLPREYRFGFAYFPDMEILSGHWMAVFDLSKSIDSDLRGHLGAEYSYNDILFPRIGYAFNYSDKNISAGFGLRYQLYSFDYAFTPYSSDLGNSHHLTVGVWFK